MNKIDASKVRKLVLVKIGGSLITDKNKPFSLRHKALQTICVEIKKAQDLTGTRLIVGHGAGSFAHVPAKKYQTHKGVLGEESYQGMAIVADVAAQLNRIVIKKLLDVGVNALSFPPHAFMTAKDFALDTMWTDSLELALEQQQLPVVYGDQMIDSIRGCSIFSTEKVLGYLGLSLQTKGYQVEKIIHCGQTNGVYDLDGKTIERITPANFENIRVGIGRSGGTDVTGGMLHKVEEALALAQQGIPSLIVDGIEQGSLAEAVQGKPVLGTQVYTDL